MSTTMPIHQWVFPARIVRIVDGDTCEMQIDCAFTVRLDATLRLYGINCPEVVGVTKEAGLAAAAFATAWFDQDQADPHAWPYLIQTRKSADRDKYGRWLATIYKVATGSCLNDELIASGNAVAYMMLVLP